MSDWKVHLHMDAAADVWQSVGPALSYDASALWCRYQRAYLQTELGARLAVMEHTSGVRAAFPHTVQDGRVSLYGAPARLHLSTDVGASLAFSAGKAFVSWLETTYRGHTILLKGEPALLRHFWGKGAQTPTVEGYCDLTLDEELLWQSVRKSYRSLVNWGKSHLGLEIWRSDNFDVAVFDAFRELHVRAAGRQTRSDASWSEQAAQIRGGEAFLVTGKLEGQLVTGMLNLLDARRGFYAVAASDRELMAADKPLAHAPLWASIVETKRAGRAVFNFGDISPAEDNKVRDINAFKRGFCTHLAPGLNLEVTL